MQAAKIRFRSWQLWVGYLGGTADTQSAPLIFVPGGPGMPHHSFLPLVRLAPPHRIHIFYDPSGSGSSDKPEGVTWDLDLFVDEIDALVRELGFTRYHLCGSSFGGLVCISHALRKPAGLASMTLAGASASYPATRACVRRAIETLPADMRDPLLATSSGKWGGLYANSPAYARAYHEYGRRFMCRIGFPPALAHATRYANMDAMITMKGRGVMYDGTLRDVDITDRLGEVDVKTLLLYGQHDALYPEVAEALHRGIRGSRLVAFPESSHMPHFEEETAFARTLHDFLDEIDGPRR